MALKCLLKLMALSLVITQHLVVMIVFPLLWGDIRLWTVVMLFCIWMLWGNTAIVYRLIQWWTLIWEFSVLVFKTVS